MMFYMGLASSFLIQSGNVYFIYQFVGISSLTNYRKSCIVLSQFFNAGLKYIYIKPSVFKKKMNSNNNNDKLCLHASIILITCIVTEQ